MKRRIIQIVTALLTNAHVSGFITGTIYKGNLKSVCVPGLNCYSCPGALGSCPIGSLQAVLGSMRYQFSYYVVGTLIAFGALLGRAVCGFLCPFGLIQELIHKIPFKRAKAPWAWPKYVKYAILLVFVIGLPLFDVNIVGMGDPAFCKYICPAGTLTAGLPLVAMNPGLQAALGWLFGWKVFVLAGVVVGCLMIYRFFCRYLCPLGAVYALFNRVSLYRMTLETEKCVGCGQCARACRMGVDPMKTPNSGECIRCGDCVTACPTDALHMPGARATCPNRAPREA